MGDLALVIIFNHRYDQNIEKLVHIYAEKFSDIFFLIPFYDGSDPRVIPVFESSVYFQGYLTQAFEKLRLNNFHYYLFLADDLILNPKINENNFRTYFPVDDDTAYIKELVDLNSVNEYWVRMEEAVRYNPNKPINRIDLKDLLPSFTEAARRLQLHGLTVSDKIMAFDAVYKRSQLLGVSLQKVISFFVSILKLIKSRWLFIKNQGVRLYYPLVGGNSDIFLIPSAVLKRFSYLCGIFASSDLFVELAIPTALVLSANKIVTEKDTKIKGIAIKGQEAIHQFEMKFDANLDNFLNQFPDEAHFVHPIKLSRWHCK